MSEWDRRELCPDGTCVGVIGSDGKCKVCGKESASGVRRPASGEEAEEIDSEVDSDGSEPDDSETADSETADSEIGDDSGGRRTPDVGRRQGDDWDQRQLCPDGACVGVIGDGGKCTVCGRTAA